MHPVVPRAVLSGSRKTKSNGTATSVVCFLPRSGKAKASFWKQICQDGTIGWPGPDYWDTVRHRRNVEIGNWEEQPA